MLLMICTICAFSSCSDDDNDSPQNPITNPVVPQTAAVGEDFTITGIGFTTGSKLFLKASDELIALPVKSASETGVVVTVPGAVVAGAYKVIIQQGGDWELGTIAITSENPITEYSVPKKSLIGGAMMIKGVGFADDCNVSLKPVLGDPVDVGTVTKVEGGIEITVPAKLEEGTYTVILNQNGNWQLGTTQIMTEIRVVIEMKHVERMYDGNELIEEMTSEPLTTTLKYDGLGRVSSIHKEDIYTDENWNVAYSENKVVITISGTRNDAPIENQITFTLDNGKVIHSVDTLENKEYTWHYDGADYLQSVTDDNQQDEIVTEYAYSDSDMSTCTFSESNFSLTYNVPREDLNNQSGVDLFALITEVMTFPDMTVKARLLGISGKYPVHLPKRLEAPEWGAKNISYTKTDGEISSIKFVDREEFDGEALETEIAYTIK